MGGWVGEKWGRNSEPLEWVTAAAAAGREDYYSQQQQQYQTYCPYMTLDEVYGGTTARWRDA